MCGVLFQIEVYSASGLTLSYLVLQSGCVNLIDSHTSLQSSHSCKLNTVAWVVELTYLDVIVKCESLLGGHGKARCTVIISEKCVVTPNFLFGYQDHLQSSAFSA